MFIESNPPIESVASSTCKTSWGARIRTRINRSKVCCAALAPRPITGCPNRRRQFYHILRKLQKRKFSGSDFQLAGAIQSNCLLAVLGGINSRLSSWKPAKTDWLSSPKCFLVMRQGFLPAEFGEKQSVGTYFYFLCTRI